MLQNHHAISKYYKAGTYSAMSVNYVRGTVLLRETMNSDIYIPSILLHVLEIPVHNLRIEAIYSSLNEVIHR